MVILTLYFATMTNLKEEELHSSSILCPRIGAKLMGKSLSLLSSQEPTVTMPRLHLLSLSLSLALSLHTHTHTHNHLISQLTQHYNLVWNVLWSR